MFPARDSGMLSADVYQTVFEFFERFGHGAMVEAAMQADELLDRPPKRGVEKRSRVIEAIEELHATQLGGPH